MRQPNGEQLHQSVQNADSFSFMGLGTDAFWLSFVEKEGAVKASVIFLSKDQCLVVCLMLVAGFNIYL